MKICEKILTILAFIFILLLVVDFITSIIISKIFGFWVFIISMISFVAFYIVLIIKIGLD